MSVHVRPWMEVTDRTVGVWFVGFGTADWMCHVFRSGDTFNITYRFKYYASPMPHDPRDLTEGKTVVIPYIGVDRVVDDIDVLAYELCENFNGTVVDRVLKKGSVDQFFNELQKKDWVHVATKH